MSESKNDEPSAPSKKPKSNYQLLLDAVVQLSEERDADIIFYAGDIQYPADFQLISAVEKHREKKNAVLMLTTPGGQPDAAYRMMRYLQRMYSDGKITLYVDSYCKSAGTLMAVGADDLMMAETAEIGPLDIQLLKPDEVGERVSGLTSMQALEALRDEALRSFENHYLSLRRKSGFQLTTKTAADIAVRLTSGWFQPLYEQLDPMWLSENRRGMSVGWEYGRRLLRGNTDTDALQQLIHGYPDHGFIIDREEAATLFKRVKSPGEAEERLASILSALGFVSRGTARGADPIVLFLSMASLAPDDKEEESEEPSDAEVTETVDAGENHADDTTNYPESADAAGSVGDQGGAVAGPQAVDGDTPSPEQGKGGTPSSNGSEPAQPAAPSALKQGRRSRRQA